jgi:quinohemoprotein amine dehydrogenase
MLPATKLSFVAVLILTGACSAHAQDAKPSPGIPINDELTISKCGGCHTRDSTTGYMRRLSYIRTTPEVWEQMTKRMIRLNGVRATPQEVSHIVRYLSNNNGLAPEEAGPVFWEAEHRLFRTQEDEAGVPAPLQRTCTYCHTIGRVLGQRRTADDYEKLAVMHMALFPGAERAVFHPQRSVSQDEPVTEVQRETFRAELQYPQEQAPPSKEPIDIALAYLSSHQPLITPEWTAWKAIMQPPKLAGTWAVNGYEKGKGRIYGALTISSTSAPDEFTTSFRLQYAATGVSIARSGKGIVYTGYSWRGRSNDTAAATVKDPSLPPEQDKEAMILSRDGNSMRGRWFWGGYDEFGIDVQLVRAASDPIVFGTDRYAVKTPSADEVHVFGVNLPADVKPSDIDFGPGIDVTKILKASPTEMALQIDVKPGLPVAMHDLTLKGATAAKTLAIYDKVSYIKVMPDASFARLGGTIAPKQYAQFEAIAFANGPDGKPNTADDVPVGPVSANWSLEEFMSTPKDDDVKFVGVINDSGLFTPSFEGPNPKRKKQANNYPTNNWGDVWVDATYRPENETLLKARSYLVVTVPTYIHYDQPEVSQ